MTEQPTTADVVSLLSRWSGPVDPAVLDALGKVDVDEVTRALSAAVADLLGVAARDAAGDDELSASILVERVVALARSGQMAMAAELAEPVLDRPALPLAARAALLRTTVLAFASEARVDDVDRILDHVDLSPGQANGEWRVESEMYMDARTDQTYDKAAD